MSFTDIIKITLLKQLQLALFQNYLYEIKTKRFYVTPQIVDISKEVIQVSVEFFNNKIKQESYPEN